MMRLATILVAAAFVSWGSAVGALHQGRSLDIDPARSRVSIAVDKSGVFSFAGHTHMVEGPIRGRVTLDREQLERSTVRLEIDAASLKVNPKGEPAGDVPKVQRAMETTVLDIARHPTIAFQSTAVSVRARKGSDIGLTLQGRLTLHGVTRAVSIPANVELGADDLAARGRLSVKQTDYGIKPVSVGGVVNVKDAVTIDFVIVAR